MVDHILWKMGRVAGVKLQKEKGSLQVYHRRPAGRVPNGLPGSHEVRFKTMVNPVDIGVRVELPAAIMEHITDVVYESSCLLFQVL